MILETARLILRPWDESDAKELYQYASDERVGPICGWVPHTSVDYSKDIIANVLNVPNSFAIILKEEDIVIGSIRVMIGEQSNIKLPDDEGEVGFWLGVPFWGRGLMPEAVKVINNYAFDILNLKKLWCGYYDGNEKSKRVQEKCGFVFNRTIENVDCPLVNEVRTMHVSCLLREIANKRIKIRDVEERDIQRIVEIYSFYVKNTAVTFEYEVPTIDEMRQRIVSRQEKYPFIVVECDGKVYGYAYANTFKVRKAYSWSCEMSVYLDINMRKGGLGRKLYEHLEKALKLMGIVNLYTCISYIDIDDEFLTKDSVHFHKRLGYKEIGKFEKSGYKFGKWYDMIYMEKVIGNHDENIMPLKPYSEIKNEI